MAEPRYRVICCQDRPTWLARRRLGITASEVAAIMGYSPWLSRFSLYWQKQDGFEEGDAPNKRRGRRFEPLILEDWQAAHPDRVTTLGGDGSICYAHLWQNIERPWQLATLDAVVDPDQAKPLELKTSVSIDGWGETGSDIIPLYYRVQLLWQMRTLGATEGYVAAWLGAGLDDFRWYRVPYDAVDLAELERAANDFRQQLAEQRPPLIDEMESTTTTLRRLHPELDDREEIVADRLAEQWRKANQAVKAAKDSQRIVENAIRQQMGNARRAVDFTGRTVALRIKYKRKAYTVEECDIDRIMTGEDYR